MSSRALLAGALTAASFISCASAAAIDRVTPEPRVVEEIVAKVNGQIITRGELTKQRAAIEAELKEQGVNGTALQDAVNKRASDALRDQIDQLLLVEKGKELNINVEADINRRVAEIQSQSKISDPDKFHEWLRQQSGESYEDFRQMMKNQIVTQRVISEEVYRNVTIPHAEVEKYYNEHKPDFIRQEMVVLREIMISVGDGSPDKVAAAEKKAKSLVDRVRKGDAKFPELARQYSDAATATADGELGAFKKGDLAKDVEDTVFKQQKGYVTDPIRRPAGFEIYRVDEHYAAGQASIEEVQGEITNKLMEPRVGPKVREYLTQLRQNSFLQIKPGYVDSGAASGKDTAWQDPAALRPETTTKEAVAAHGHKKFLKVIPYGRVGPKGKEDSSVPTAPVTPVPQTPASTQK